ncbi:MAG TPA: hypothetical protein PL124_11215 [Candidatus Cloacimonadota bacterium]|nr:hypothetical protein [Candidatus Cloacimonadota bacterium]
MNTSSFDIIELIALLVGTGGLGAFITAKAQSYKYKADAVSGLSAAFEERVTKLEMRNDGLACKIQSLEDQISGLKTMLSDRDTLIDTLQSENQDLQKQVNVLKSQITLRDKRIKELEKQVDNLKHLWDNQQNNATGLPTNPNDDVIL